MLDSPATNPDVQEALSKRYCNEIIILLPLKSGKIAVFNSVRDLCGFIPATADIDHFEDWLHKVWKPPEPIQPQTIDLKELGLL